MEFREYTLGQCPRDPRNSRDVFHTRGLHALHAAEMLEQRLAARGADAADLLQRRRRPRLAAPRAMALDREAMRFVANLLQQVQARMVGRKVEHFVAVGEHDVLLAGLALGALGD